MRDIVLVTTYFRPEYLWLCLQAIADADGGKDKEVWVAHDHHKSESADPENLEIENHFKEVFAAFRWIDRAPHTHAGNSYNCLELYKEAYKTDARFVYLVEDDILVEKDFFRWNEAVQSKGDYFCSVGWHCKRNPKYVLNTDPTAYIESTDDYVSWGVCWKREKLAWTEIHCCEAYYRDMVGYTSQKWPSYPKDGFVEQDGLIQRMLAEPNALRVVAWPCLKRAYHVGISGYHRPGGHRFLGTLSEKVQQLDRATKSGELVKLRKDYVANDDIDVPRGGTPEWSQPKVVQTLGTASVIGRMLTFNIISNISNGLGLQRDAELLKRLIESMGHQVVLTQHTNRHSVPCDVNIFLELVAPLHFPYARENWFFPNSEWFLSEWNSSLSRMNLILCKTKDCQEIWVKKVGNRAVYVGFEANDFFDPRIPRQKSFLHLAGGSSTKNTAAVVSSWRFPYPLTVVSYGGEVKVPRNVPNVRVMNRISEQAVRILLNENQYHIMPSMYEGYGHSLHESLGCGAVLITTDAPPMNEFTGVSKDLLVPVAHKEPRMEAYLYKVNATDVARSVLRALDMPDDLVKRISTAARDGFVQDRLSFRAELAKIVHAASVRIANNRTLPIPPCPPFQPPTQQWHRGGRAYTNDGLVVNWWDTHRR